MATEARRPEDLVSLAQKPLGVVVPPLGRSHEPERQPGRRVRRDVRGPDRLTRLEREALCVIEPPLAEQHLGEQALALDQRAPVAEGLEDADRLPQHLLRTAAGRHGRAQRCPAS